MIRAKTGVSGWTLFGVGLVLLALLMIATGAVAAQDAGIGGVPVEAIEDPAADPDNNIPEAIDDAANFELWELVVATFLVPAGTAIVNRKGMSKSAQRGAMVVVAVVVAVGGSYFRGELTDWQFTAAAAMKIVVVTQAMYASLWKTPLFGNALARLEAVTGGDPVAVQAARRDGAAVPAGA